MRPRTLKEAVGRIAAGEEERIAVDEFLDEFYLAMQGLQGQPEPQSMIDEEPPIL